MTDLHEVPPLSRADILILQCLAGGRVATGRQLALALDLQAGYSARNTAGRLARLRRHELIVGRAIHRDMGQASQVALALTPLGGRFTGPDATIVPLALLQNAQLRHRLQLFELSNWMREEDWEQVPSSSLPEALRTWALSRYRGRALTSSELQDRQLLQRAPLPALSSGGIRHRETGETRIVLEVRPGVRLRTQLAALEGYALCEPLGIELVGADAKALAAARKTVERWAEGTTATRRRLHRDRAGRGEQPVRQSKRRTRTRPASNRRSHGVAIHALPPWSDREDPRWPRKPFWWMGAWRGGRGQRCQAGRTRLESAVRNPLTCEHISAGVSQAKLL